MQQRRSVSAPLTPPVRRLATGIRPFRTGLCPACHDAEHVKRMKCFKSAMLGVCLEPIWVALALCIPCVRAAPPPPPPVAGKTSCHTVPDFIVRHASGQPLSVFCVAVLVLALSKNIYLPRGKQITCYAKLLLCVCDQLQHDNSVLAKGPTRQGVTGQVSSSCTLPT